jgi:outer membrane biosynthesis protein TonB
MAEQLKKSKVINTAKELNEILGLDPQIPIKKVDLEEIKKKILEARGLIHPDDTISSETIEVIETLEQEQQEKETSPEEEKETSPEEEKEAPSEEEKEAPSEEEKDKEEVPDIKEAEAEAEKKPKKGAKEKGKKETKQRGLTRPQAAGHAIREGKGKTIDELIRDTDRIFVAGGGKSNLAESKFSVTRAIQILSAFGAIEMDEDTGTIR